MGRSFIMTINGQQIAFRKTNQVPILYGDENNYKQRQQYWCSNRSADNKLERSHNYEEAIVTPFRNCSISFVALGVRMWTRP